MQRLIKLMVVVLILGVAPLLAACGEPNRPPKVEPARLEEIPGSEFKSVIITEKAAQRLDMQTVPVREEEVVRTRTVGGEVVGLQEGEASELGPVWAHVSLPRSDWSQVDLGQASLVQALGGGDEGDEGWLAEPDEGPGHDDAEDVDLPGEDLVEDLYYLIASPGQGLKAGQAVLVELSLSIQDPLRKVVPYAAVLYGVHGETWVYTNPEPLVYVRQAITIDYIEGDLAILSEGPEAGTEVVTVGAAELFGTETGVSK
jgi:hypothetical protein